MRRFNGTPGKLLTHWNVCCVRGSQKVGIQIKEKKKNYFLKNENNRVFFSPFTKTVVINYEIEFWGKYFSPGHNLPFLILGQI